KHYLTFYEIVFTLIIFIHFFPPKSITLPPNFAKANIAIIIKNTNLKLNLTASKIICRTKINIFNTIDHVTLATVPVPFKKPCQVKLPPHFITLALAPYFFLFYVALFFHYIFECLHLSSFLQNLNLLQFEHYSLYHQYQYDQVYRHYLNLILFYVVLLIFLTLYHLEIL